MAQAALPPGLAGWVAMQEANSQLSERNISGLAKMQAMADAQQTMAKRAAYEQEIASVTDPKERLRISQKYMGAEALGKSLQDTENKRAQMAVTRETTLARIQQSWQIFETRMNETRRQADTAEKMKIWDQQFRLGHEQHAAAWRNAQALEIGEALPQVQLPLPMQFSGSPAAAAPAAPPSVPPGTPPGAAPGVPSGAAPGAPGPAPFRPTPAAPGGAMPPPGAAAQGANTPEAKIANLIHMLKGEPPEIRAAVFAKLGLQDPEAASGAAPPGVAPPGAAPTAVPPEARGGLPAEVPAPTPVAVAPGPAAAPVPLPAPGPGPVAAPVPGPGPGPVPGATPVPVPVPAPPPGPAIAQAPPGMPPGAPPVGGLAAIAEPPPVSPAYRDEGARGPFANVISGRSVTPLAPGAPPAAAVPAVAAAAGGSPGEPAKKSHVPPLPEIKKVTPADAPPEYKGERRRAQWAHDENAANLRIALQERSLMAAEVRGQESGGILNTALRMRESLNRDLKPYRQAIDSYERFNQIHNSGDTAQANQFLAVQLQQMAQSGSGQRGFSWREFGNVLGKGDLGGSWASRVENAISQAIAGVRTPEIDKTLNLIADAMGQAAAERAGDAIKNARSQTPANMNPDNIVPGPQIMGRFIITPYGTVVPFKTEAEARARFQEGQQMIRPQ